ncbi:MAG: acetylxylan esterase [Kiritimatiellaeota bacterium]|nr:acetylxylan esterase [Kiritimatiellota bacterium]
MRRAILLFVCAAAALGQAAAQVAWDMEALAWAVTSIPSRAAAQVAWDMEALFAVPKVYDAPAFYTNGVKACFYESVPYTGMATRVFAYYGVPEGRGGKVPAMVLVHGGGGSAFFEWVRLWNGRGYAAIAMDTCGCVSSNGYQNHPRHTQGGPPGWGGWTQTKNAVTDQWPYHAVAAAVKGHSLLRSFAEVDGDRVGVTGISWGGYLTCIVASLDTRFAFAVPVYGCGDFESIPIFGLSAAEERARWVSLWDPLHYLPSARVPFLWVTGSNDFAFPLNALQKSYRLLNAPSTLCVRVRMPHGHGGAGENPAEIFAFAQGIVGKGALLPKVSAPTREGRKAEVRVGQAAAFTAELNYTRDGGVWKERQWETLPAQADAAAGRASAELPEGTTAYYFNVLLPGNLVVSSEHEEIVQ